MFFGISYSLYSVVNSGGAFDIFTVGVVQIWNPGSCKGVVCCVVHFSFEWSVHYVVRNCNKKASTVRCRYNVVQHHMVLKTAQQWLKQNIYYCEHLQKSPHISPSRATYGMLIVRNCNKKANTVRCRYNAVQYHMVLHTNLDQRCRTTGLRILLYWEAIDLELQGQIELENQNFLHFEFVHTISHHQLKLEPKNLDKRCKTPRLRSLWFGDWLMLILMVKFNSKVQISWIPGLSTRENI